jgi:hypothetical protein
MKYFARLFTMLSVVDERAFSTSFAVNIFLNFFHTIEEECVIALR